MGMTAQAIAAGTTMNSGASQNTTRSPGRRYEVLFRAELDAVCESLQQTPRSDPVRPDSRLNSAEYLALGKHEHQRRERNDYEDRESLDYEY